MSNHRHSFQSAAEVETIALGERIGRVLLPGDLIALSGPLGAGKTVLVRGIAQGLGADPRVVRSPTFVLHHVYPTEPVPLHHIDLYRLGAGADITFLDFDGLLENGVIAVEWGELADLRRFDPMQISIDGDPSGGRCCVLEAGAPDRVAAVWDGATTR